MKNRKSCPMCYVFNDKSPEVSEYCCKNCGYAYTNQTKSKVISVGHSQFPEVDMLDCTPEPPDFYLRPETQLNFDHK